MALAPEMSFLDWLRQGASTNHLEINDVQAKIHIADGAVFLVSPEIFKLFIKETSGSVGEEWREEQKAFQKLRPHLRGKEGKNIWTCEVRDPRNTRKVKGYILENPTTLFPDSLPENNPYLTSNEKD
ncbi:TPA: DNA-binding domain-containing protein [Klebsiella michiganensis]|uniref:conjugal transfer nickase/helicase domain-containing protein n=1 Tax=Enterobacteriaceae TaxID=543 RepID=UPI002890B72A|nr:DNA-binding domain-containing protein [Klebsiella michiganensis]